MHHSKTVLPAEWDQQSGIMMTWPHEDTDWKDMLDEVEKCFLTIALSVLKYEKLLIVCLSKTRIESLIPDEFKKNLRLIEIETNDTWARDHGPITVMKDGKPCLMDFKFNGWGLKFAADKDNLISRQLFQKKYFGQKVMYENNMGIVMEGGSIESDGEGTVLTTSECLLSPNRNGNLNRTQIEDILKLKLGADRILWLNHGYLSGDDTDSHTDTLARFCDVETIAYVKCDNDKDEHYAELKLMEDEIKQLRTKDLKPYKLVPLPMADPVWHDNHRLPATYANFLIINNAVLVPAYGTEKDKEVENIIRNVFPDREIIMVNCLPLIKQHGSLHCVTMQFPNGVID